MLVYTGNYNNVTDGTTIVFPNKATSLPTYDYQTYPIGQAMDAGDVFNCGLTTLVRRMSFKSVHMYFMYILGPKEACMQKQGILFIC